MFRFIRRKKHNNNHDRNKTDRTSSCNMLHVTIGCFGQIHVTHVMCSLVSMKLCKSCTCFCCRLLTDGYT